MSNFKKYFGHLAAAATLTTAMGCSEQTREEALQACEISENHYAGAVRHCQNRVNKTYDDIQKEARSVSLTGVYDDALEAEKKIEKHPTFSEIAHVFLMTKNELTLEHVKGPNISNGDDPQELLDFITHKRSRLENTLTKDLAIIVNNCFEDTKDTNSKRPMNRRLHMQAGIAECMADEISQNQNSAQHLTAEVN